jgi:YebC/PmpR family DNA-binding regulatory protein
MSGHSKWATTHRQKSAADAKRGSTFTRLAHAITVAAREKGVDIEANSQLRIAVEKARAANMPKDNIERAIKRGSGVGSDGNVLEELLYEVLGPFGSAFILEILTDSRNRTASTVKSILNKYNAQLAGQNSVSWMFNRQTHITFIPPKTDDLDTIELELIEVGVEDIIKQPDYWTLIITPGTTDVIRTKSEELGAKIDEITTGYFPKEPIQITDPEVEEKLSNLHQALEEVDEVSNIYNNVSI